MTNAFARDVAVIGAGPAGLMAAEVAATGGARVTVFEAMPSAGRKLLMAGRGGLNLTHSEPLPAFLSRYGEAAGRLAPSLKAFSPSDLRAWSNGLGEETFVGSSGRVFPKSFKASPLLRAWLRRLDGMGVELALRHRWMGWNGNGELLLQSPRGPIRVVANAVVLALGGASWPRLGADGNWVDLLAGRGVAVAPLRPANCGFAINWSDRFKERFAGTPIKTISLSFAERTVRGEAVVTREGIEGGAIYALSAALRDAIEMRGQATLRLDLRPDLSPSRLREQLSAPRGKQSISTFLRKVIGLSPVGTGLLQEAAHRDGAALSELSPSALADRINNLSLVLAAPSSLARAISTAGGIRLDELDDGYMLRRLPGVFAAGEMLDWEAPTGGYLLQASFATGAAAGRGALKWLEK
jgi:uncharacterized flavoprotein (TIGR03862 family)